MNNKRKPKPRIAALVAGTVALYTTAVSAETYPFGDINRDGAVDIVDSQQAAQKSVDLEGVPWFPMIRGDVNCDYTVDIVDALIIAQFSVGIINSFPCSTERQALVTALDGNAEAYYDYLEERFEWVGLDGNGIFAELALSENPSLANNAESQGRYVTVGPADGVRSLSWAYSFDLVAHEITHSIISETTEVATGGEAGAVNESFADVMAVFASASEETADWHMGEAVWTPAISGDALRHLDDPNAGFNRNTLEACRFNPELPFLCGQADHLLDYVNSGLGTQHISQGILNYAAYLLVEGGINEGVSVQGIGVKKAEQIYFRAMTEYLPMFVRFSDVRLLLENTCNELIGQYDITESDCASVGDAFTSVGILSNPVGTPIGINGKITERGIPVSGVTVVLRAKSIRSFAINTDILQVETDADGVFLFDDATIAAALAALPPLEVAFSIGYFNPDSSDLNRISEWQTDLFQMNVGNQGTVLPTIDIGNFGTYGDDMTDPSVFPVTVSWSPRTDTTEYFLWMGCRPAADPASGVKCSREFLTRLHPTASIVIEDNDLSDVVDSIEPILFSDLTSWRVQIRSYAGQGITNVLPM